MIVVDTSVLVDFFKGKTTPPAERFREIESEGIPFALPLICGQELLQGARDEREWSVLDEYLSTQRLLHVARAGSATPKRLASSSIAAGAGSPCEVRRTA